MRAECSRLETFTRAPLFLRVPLVLRPLLFLRVLCSFRPSLPILALFLGLLCSLLPGLAAPAAAQEPLVFATASLKDAVEQVFAAQKLRARVAVAASSVLARQVEAGAPADIFISADIPWMDYLADRRLLRPGTRVDLLGNRLSLVAAKAPAVSIELKPGVDLLALLGPEGRLAISQIDSVPSGRYGRAALQALQIWPQVEKRLAQTEHVRAALALVARGEAPLGIVYRTDAAAEPRVHVLADFPASSHPPIVYPAAIIATSRHPQAEAYLAHLRSQEAAAIFSRLGFVPLGQNKSN